MRRSASLSLLAGLIACFALLSGCGGDTAADQPAAESEASESREVAVTTAEEHAYEEVLRGLRRAAVADAGYNALRRAKGLAAPHKAVIDAFCNFAWQIGANREPDSVKWDAYVVGRITNSAEISYPPPIDDPVEPAMDQLQGVIDLSRLSPGLVARYKRACES